MVAIATPCVAQAEATRVASKPHDLVRDVAALASLPGACHRVMQLADDQRASAREMAEVIDLEPGLCARLLRLVNSPYYGLPCQIESVAHAVQIIGTNALRNLALATGAVTSGTRSDKIGPPDPARDRAAGVRLYLLRGRCGTA